MSLTKVSVAFKPPPLVEEPWYRVATRGGSRSDVKKVLDFLGKLWSFDQSDPRAFDEWLIGQGVRKKDLQPEKLSDHKNAFRGYEEAKLDETRKLVEGLALGPHSPKFFASLRGFSTGLKRLAYRTAVSVSREEKFVVALCALSQEGSELAQESVSDLPSSAVLQTFLTYLKGTRLPLALQSRQSLPLHPKGERVERLFQLAALPVKKLEEELSRLSQPEIETLARLAENLFQRLPNRGFGTFAKLNLSLLICIADPRSASADLAKKILMSSGEPSVAEVLALMGKDHLLAELRNGQSARQIGRARFLAAALDSLRKRYRESIADVKEDLKLFSRSRIPVLALAGRACLVQLGLQKESNFEKFLLKKLQNDRQGFVTEWLLRNPEFVHYLDIGRIPLKTWKAILQSCMSDRPAVALNIVKHALQTPLDDEGRQYWEEALGVLERIGGDEADSIFSDLVVRQIERGWNPQFQDLLTRDPSWSLLRRNFWILLASTAGEQNWAILLDAIRVRTSESELVSILETAVQKDGVLTTWILREFLPKLLAEESLSPNFHRFATKRAFLVAAAKEVSKRTFENAKYLRDFANEWASLRDEAKKNLLSSIRAGLEVALHNCVSNTVLRSQLSKLSENIDSWAASDTPRLEGSIEAIASTQLAAQHSPDKNLIEKCFGGQASAPHDFPLFAGANSWVIDVIFEAEQGPWPKPELLLEQIVKSFTFFTNLRRRADTELHALEHTIKVELAVTLREELSDIETELTGYFVFRDVLEGIGLHPVMPRLGGRLEQRELSSEKHKLIRDPNRQGLLRVFSLGIRVGDTVVGSATVMKTGNEDDRD